MFTKICFVDLICQLRLFTSNEFLFRPSIIEGTINVTVKQTDLIFWNIPIVENSEAQTNDVYGLSNELIIPSSPIRFKSINEIKDKFLIPVNNYLRYAAHHRKFSVNFYRREIENELMINKQKNPNTLAYIFFINTRVCFFSFYICVRRI